MTPSPSSNSLEKSSSSAQPEKFLRLHLPPKPVLANPARGTDLTTTFSIDIIPSIEAETPQKKETPLPIKLNSLKLPTFTPNQPKVPISNPSSITINQNLPIMTTEPTILVETVSCETKNIIPTPLAFIACLVALVTFGMQLWMWASNLMAH